MKIARLLLIASFLFADAAAFAQGTAPTFRYSTTAGVVTLPGKDPAQGGTTVIPTVLVPVRLQFETAQAAGKPATLDPMQIVPRVLLSPVFSSAAFPAETTQYADAMLRVTLGTQAIAGWHTLIGQPEVKPVTVKIPAGYGYLLTSKRTGTVLGIADAEYVQRAIFLQIPHQDGKLVIAMTRNTAYYVYGKIPVVKPEPCVAVAIAPATEICGNDARLCSANPFASITGASFPYFTPAPTVTVRALSSISIVSNRLRETCATVLSAMVLNECRDPSARTFAHFATTCCASSTVAGV
jgi:hypothetical protein